MYQLIDQLMYLSIKQCIIYLSIFLSIYLSIYLYIGACIAGLGDKIAGLYSSDDKLLQQIIAASKRTDELLWHMPLEASYKESIKGTYNDSCSNINFIHVI
jgi:hypothetical protein